MVSGRRVELVKRRVSNWNVRDLWVEVPIGGGWLAAYRLFENKGRLEVAELRVFPDEPIEGDPDSYAYHYTTQSPGHRRAGTWSAENLGDRAPLPAAGGLTVRKAREATSFRAFRDSMREILTRLRLDEGQEEELFGPGGLLAERRIEQSMYDRGGRGPRTTHDDRSLAEIAATYVDVLLTPGERRPVLTAAEKAGYSPQHFKRLVKKARERGLLTETPRRRAGGELTPKARALLESTEGGKQ